MDASILGPFIRGLALAESGGGPVVVTASTSEAGTSLPAGVPVVDLAEGGDEAAAQAALRAAYAKAGSTLGRVLAIRRAGAATLLFSAAPSIETAASLLAKPGSAPSGAAVPAAPAATAAIAGIARGRDRVVEGKIALVTGGAQGFGEEIVRGLCASGALVWIADLNLAGAERLATELNAGAGKTVGLPLAMDVSSEESVLRAFAEIARRSGCLDLVVSNAGVLKAASVLEQGLADFEFVTRVNYTGFFLVAKHAGLMLRRQRLGAPAHRSDLIQINSKSGLEGSNKNGAYAGSKFGGLGLVQSFALELVEYGIKVNAICPGNFFDGPLWSDPDRGLFVQYLRTGKVPAAKTIADVRSFYEAKVPMGRGCEGPDVMRAIFYLVEQVYETGQALPVTGGQVMLN